MPTMYHRLIITIATRFPTYHVDIAIRLFECLVWLTC